MSFKFWFCISVVLVGMKIWQIIFNMHTELFESIILLIPVATRKLFRHQWLVNSDCRKDKVIWFVAYFIIWHFSVNWQKTLCNRKWKSIWWDHRVKSCRIQVFWWPGALPRSLSRPNMYIWRIYMYYVQIIVHCLNKTYKTSHLTLQYNTLIRMKVYCI